MMDFLMPKLSDTMEEGTILQWLVADGTEVTKGQAIVEIETDKANMMVEAPESGTLQIRAQLGDSLPIGAPIAAIGATGTAPAAPPVEAPAVEASGEQAPPGQDTSTGIPTADDGTGRSIGREISSEANAGAVGRGDGSSATIEAPPPETPPAATVTDDHEEHVRASPLARRLAEERGVDLTTIRGTGPAGRIVREDVEAAVAGASPPTVHAASEVHAASNAPAPPAAPAGPTPSQAGPPAAGDRIALTRLQRTIARRMGESKPGAPHFYLQRDVDVTALAALRRELVAASAEGEGPSITDLLIRAVALATADRPDAVRRFDGDALVAAPGIHVGLAVAVPDGLLVPVVRDAADKRIAEIAATTRDLVSRCRDGSITPPELEGSAVTISNLGMFGIDRFFAVINPPEAAILAVGRAKPSPVVVDDQVVVRDILTLSLSVDHRALYGAEAATYLARIAELLERPGALVL